MADPLRLKQILINLLGNAVKFTPDNGRVRITAAPSSAETVLITVEDTGIGMSPEEIETALRPFGQVDSGFNKRHEGTGLGLPIAYALSRMHGGELRIASEKDIGTRISVTLPLAPAPDTNAARTQS
jgi:two-component system, cell cycle sensor histidine kinase PleC